MAKVGEKWVEKVLESRGYKLNSIGTEDVFGSKDLLGIVVEEKDLKDLVKVYRNKIYVRGINGRWYYKPRKQVVNYGYKIKQQDIKNNVYRYIICVYVCSRLQGRQVQPIYFRKFGTIFVVSKSYFPIWLHSLERTYIGEPTTVAESMYMGGK